jgi:hypothetical protein
MWKMKIVVNTINIGYIEAYLQPDFFTICSRENVFCNSSYFYASLKTLDSYLPQYESY